MDASAYGATGGLGWNAGPPWAARPPHPSVARIVVPEGNATSYGSGTLVDVREQYGLVITNWHVVRDAKDQIEVVFPGGFRSLARVAKLDSDWDLAALIIWRPPLEPIRLAAAAPQPGDFLSIAGYGKGNYRLASGRCTQYLAPASHFPQELVEISVQARQGDSGGPILNDRGELAGVLFGAGQGITLGSYSGRVERFLATVIPTGPANVVPFDPAPVAVASVPPSRESELIPIDRHALATHEAWKPVTGSTHSPPVPPAASNLPGEIELASAPPPRSIPAPSPLPTWEHAPPVAAISSQESPDSGPRSITWSDIAGPTFYEQAKTVLAACGVFSLLFVALRKM